MMQRASSARITCELSANAYRSQQVTAPVQYLFDTFCTAYCNIANHPIMFYLHSVVAKDVNLSNVLS
jgi:hypothetical protein